MVCRQAAGNEARKAGKRRDPERSEIQLSGV